MKKTFIALTVLFLLFCYFATAEAKIKISFATQDFYPYSYLKDNRIGGPGAEIIRTVCNRINADYTISIQPWRRSILMVKKGQCQALFMIGKNQEREKWISFSPPIISAEYGFFECLESPLGYSGPESLKGKRVGVYGPSNTSVQLEKLIKNIKNNVFVDLTPDDISQFRKLARCRVDAVYSNKDVGMATIKKIQAKNIKYTGTDKVINYYIGFSRRNTPEIFIRRFNNEINRMKMSGELKQLLGRYDMQAAP